MRLIMSALFTGLMNRFRGVDWISKTAYAASVFASITFMTLDPVIGWIAGLGKLLEISRGWGKYFVAIHGSAKIYRETKEVQFIDDITHWIMIPTNLRERKIWGMIAMGLRRFIFAVPMVLALVWYKDSYLPLIYSPIFLLFGVAYWLTNYLPKEITNRFFGYVGSAELMTGILTVIYFYLI